MGKLSELFGRIGFKIKDGELVKYKGIGREAVIPKGVKSIGKEAFYECDTLESAVISEYRGNGVCMLLRA